MGGTMSLEIFGDGRIKRNGANSVSIGVGPFVENPKDVVVDYTLVANTNAMSAGPLTIANNVTVTIGDGSEWTVV
jgi:hypothetical protein